jgi:hypothetical protein
MQSFVDKGRLDLGDVTHEEELGTKRIMRAPVLQSEVISQLLIRDYG